MHHIKPLSRGQSRLLALIAGAMLLSGCTRHYIMRLNNGSQIEALGKPALRKGSFYYKDASGREAVVPAGHVLEVEPASMAGKESKLFTPPLSHQ